MATASHPCESLSQHTFTLAAVLLCLTTIFIGECFYSPCVLYYQASHFFVDHCTKQPPLVHGAQLPFTHHPAPGLNDVTRDSFPAHHHFFERTHLITSINPSTTIALLALCTIPFFCPRGRYNSIRIPLSSPLYHTAISIARTPNSHHLKQKTFHVSAPSNSRTWHKSDNDSSRPHGSQIPVPRLNEGRKGRHGELAEGQHVG